MPAHCILHVLGTADEAGEAICRMVEDLASSLDRRKFVLEVCFLRCGKLIGRFRNQGIQPTCVDWNGSPMDPIGAAKYAKLLRSTDFDLIHQHTGGRFLTGMSRFLTSAPIVRHIHGRAFEATGLVPPRMRLPKRDATIANSNSVAEACGDPNAIVIYPGIDLNEFGADRGSDPQPVVIGTACRLEPVKDVKTLIRAIAFLAQTHPSVRFEIAGDGSQRRTLQDEVVALGLSGRVSFLGWSQDLPSVLKSWSIFVQPSLDEGFGVAVLEAMASGLAVVASDVGGLRELVQDGRTGFLVEAGAPSRFAEKIRLLLDNPELRASMGAAGRQRAYEEFSLEQMVTKTAALYDSLLGPAV
jgi:glycosyltransferase involved in cell wall biosynthesis